MLGPYGRKTQETLHLYSSLVLRNSPPPLNPRASRKSSGRVVFVVESPFSLRDARRFGVHDFESRGYQVEVWDVSRIYLPKSIRQWTEPYSDNEPRLFHELKELGAPIRNLSKSDLVILMSGPYRGQERSHRQMIELFQKSNAILSTVSTSSLPSVKSEKTRGFPALYLVAKNRLKRSVLLSLLAFRRQLVRFWLSKPHSGLRRLDHVWLGTTSENIVAHLIDRKTKIKYIHALDFDQVIDGPSAGPEIPLLLVDSMGPTHPDFATHSLEASTVPVDVYFQTVRQLLERVEELSQSSAVVAAHPRAAPGTLEEFYNRPVFYGLTHDLVARARLVVLTSMTTAVNWVVAYSKPAIMITSPNLGQQVVEENTYLARVLGLATIGGLQETVSEEPIEIDEEAYKRYFSAHVKRPRTPADKFWQQVLEALQ